MLNPHQISLVKKELQFQTSRSGGKGGQNVNKVETKVELLFNVSGSLALSPMQKDQILNKLSNRINEEGYLKLSESSSRSQFQNKELVIEKLIALLNKALHVQKKRKATKPSKASKLKKLEGKKKRSEVKQLRKKIF